MARRPADNNLMLFLLTLLTAAYVAGVVWVRRSVRAQAAATAAAPRLPAPDQAPASAVGWPPDGPAFATYVDEGFAALDAFLQEGFTA